MDYLQRITTLAVWQVLISKNGGFSVPYYACGSASGLMRLVELVVALVLHRTLALCTFRLGVLPDEGSYRSLNQ